MIRIRIPATTANLGPGFDCMGLALDLWNSFEMHLQGEVITVSIDGEGVGVLATDDTNLIATTFAAEVQRLGLAMPAGILFKVHNAVPCASGLGSSSTATLAGIMFAQAYAAHAKGGDPAEIDPDETLRRAVEVEGHGDNVAPALLGGFVIVVPDGEGVLTQKVPHTKMKVVVCVPDFKYLTADARKALPDSYSKPDAIYNIGRAMLVAEAFRAGNDELLKGAMNDRIHEPFRLKDIPGAMSVKQAALDAGALCVCLSGAGPGIIAFTRDGFDRIGRAMKDAYKTAGLDARYWILDTSEEGTHVGRLPV
ncbi:MAG: homoserine kinase [Armatimonadetes bacterium]|nr:homoserine kinase [Armatimonadota bacterium]